MMEPATMPLPCDILIVDGLILTLDSEHRIFKQGAIAITDERIVSVGSQFDLTNRYTATQVIQAQGGIVRALSIPTTILL